MSITIFNTIAFQVIQEAAKYPERLAAALFAEMLIEQKESMRRTPVLTGAARGSHITNKPVISGREISVTIEVGGPSLDYVVPLHERVDVFHKNGQAKFLESTLLESAPFMAQRVARRLLGLNE